MPNKNVKKIIDKIFPSHRSTLFYHENYPNRKIHFLNSDHYKNIYWDLYIGARHDSCGAHARLIHLANDVMACYTLALVCRDHKHDKNDEEAVRWLNKVLEIEQYIPLDEKMYSDKAKFLLTELRNEPNYFDQSLLYN